MILQFSLVILGMGTPFHPISSTHRCDFRTILYIRQLIYPCAFHFCLIIAISRIKLSRGYHKQMGSSNLLMYEKFRSCPSRGFPGLCWRWKVVVAR